MLAIWIHQREAVKVLDLIRKEKSYAEFARIYGKNKSSIVKL